jgi:hypothetical protein
MTVRSALGRVERQSGMGISPKTELRCHNLSRFSAVKIFKHEILEKR